MNSTPPIIHLEGITKSYRTGEWTVPVLKGVDLRIEQGEYVAIMGRSGAGKSTLMNIIGCMDHPTDGAYWLAGQDVATLEDDALSEVRGRTIGFVFQSFHLLKDLSVQQNVELPMEYQEIDPAARAARAKDLLDQVGLGHRIDHRPLQLSGGERQRVAIARALANEPKVLLADEPTGNLDAAARGEVLALFEQLRKDRGVTLIMVTHDDLIGRLAPRCVLVEEGRVRDAGRP